jgi:hypothetical protein
MKITQAPLNKSRWYIQLECGHEVLITRRSLPTAKEYICKWCET